MSRRRASLTGARSDSEPAAGRRRGAIAAVLVPVALAGAVVGRKALLRLFTRLSGTWVGRSS